MKNIPPYLRIYQQILKDLENAFPYLKVVGVAPNSLAMQSGILPGDIILQVGNRPISSV